MPEYFDILDPVTGEPTGRRELRSTVHRQGLYHACVHVWIYDVFPCVDGTSSEPCPPQPATSNPATEARLLLQRRSKQKDSFPYYFDISSAGHLVSGENHLVCVVREVYEELGILMQFDLSEYLCPHSTDPPSTPSSSSSQTAGPECTICASADMAALVRQQEDQLAQIRLQLYPPQSSDTAQIDSSFLEHYHNDSPELRTAVVAAQYVFNHNHGQAGQSSTSLDQRSLAERFPSRDYPVTVSTVLNPEYSRRTALHFCGKILQESYIVSDEFIDNEFAYVFFLQDTFYTPQQILQGAPLSRPDANQADQPIVLTSDDDSAQPTQVQEQSLLTTSKPLSPTGHVLQYLDDEVASCIYIPIAKYLQLQQELYDLSHPTQPSPSSSDGVSPAKDIVASPSRDCTLFDPMRPCGSDETDVLDKDWLVPITTLPSYTRTVFSPMLQVAARSVSKSGSGSPGAQSEHSSASQE